MFNVTKTHLENMCCWYCRISVV